MAKDSLDRAVLSAQKKLTGVEITKLGKGRQAASQVKEWYATGLSVLDHWLYSGGGMPGGRMTEVIGSEGSAKTSLVYAMLGGAQRAGCRTVFLDTEGAFDEQRAEVMGCDPGELVVARAYTLEAGIDTLRHFLETNDTGRPIVLGFDSVVGAPTNADAARGASEAAPGEIARVFSREMPKLAQLVEKSRGHVVFVNQVREQIGILYGDKEKAPGGRAMKFYTSNRFQFRGGKKVTHAKTGQHTGKLVTLTCIKARFSPPWRKAQLRLDYETGWNEEWSTLEHAKEVGVVAGRTKGGAAVRGAEAYEAALKALGWPAPNAAPALRNAPTDDDTTAADTDDESEDQ